jgi:NADH dehydrogenase
MKRNTLFITGGAGFMGSCLLQKLHFDDFENIYCLDKIESPNLSDYIQNKNFKFIKGDIFDVKKYEEYLSASDIVMHLAAATGKTTPKQYSRINKEGTEILTQQCKKAGVKNFLYISTIAVQYPDIKHYYYAQTKLDGENVVKSSGLNYTIVRPTIVIGAGSAILQSLTKLANAPIAPIFGNGRTTIQPIYIDDLIDCYITIIKENLFQNKIFDLGGPEKITIENFMKSIRHIQCQKELKAFHIPLPLIIYPLSLLEKLFLKLLPFTVGQLSLFRYESTISEDRQFQKGQTTMKNVDNMLESSFDERKKDEQIAILNKECEVFYSYLLHEKPDDYILRKYSEGNIKCGLEFSQDTPKFERMLVQLARLNTFFTKIVDTYTCFFLNCSLIRKKMTLLLAILECYDKTCTLIDSIKPIRKIALYPKIVLKGSFFAFTLLFSVIIFLPFHIAMGTKLNKG